MGADIQAYKAAKAQWTVARDEWQKRLDYYNELLNRLKQPVQTSEVALAVEGVAPQATNEMQPVSEQAPIDNTAMEVAQETQNMQPVQETVAENQSGENNEMVEPVGNSEQLTNDVKTEDVNQSENNLEMVAEGENAPLAEISNDERAEMEARIVDWLSEENLERAEGKTREEIFDEFGNELEPIAYIPKQYISLVSADLKDQRIYCGKGYFIDHALRNHAKDGKQLNVEDVDVSKYLNIQSVLDNPDSVKETYVDGKRTIVFIKKIGRYFAELTQVEEDGKIVLHKSLFNQKKEPYAKLNDIRSKGTSSEGGVSSISHTADAAPAISLESRGDVVSNSTVSSVSEDRNYVSNEQENTQKSDENAENGGEITETPANPTDSEPDSATPTNEDELEIYLAELKAQQERQKTIFPKLPKPSSFVEAYASNDTEAINKLDKQLDDALQMLVPMDITMVEATIKGMKDRKSIIKAGSANERKETPAYKAFDHIEKALAKRKKQLEKKLSEDEKRKVDIIRRGNRGEWQEIPQPKQENKPVDEPINDEVPVNSELTEQPETNEVANAGPVNMETLQLNMGDEDFNALLNGGDKTAISEYLAEMDGLLRIGVGSPLDGQEALREEYRKAVEQYGKENIPAEVMDDLNSRMQPYSDLSRAIFDRKYALQDKLREIEASEAQANELAEKEAKAEHKNTAFGGFLAGKTDVGASTAEKALSKKYNFDGKVMTVAEFVEDAVGNGNVKLSAIEEPKYKGASRAAWNRMDARQQEADAKRVKESGTKTVYTVNDHDLGKTAYDYAKFLLDKKAEQEKADAKKAVEDVIKPFAKEKREETDEGIMFRTTYHGSGAKFDKFDHSFMGTGEGAQAFGWGTYVTEVEDIGRTYAGVGVTKLGPLQAKLGNIDSAISSLEKEVQKAEKNLTSDNETARHIAAYTLETASERRKALEEEKTAVEEEIKSYRNLYTVEIPDDNGSNYLYWKADNNQETIGKLNEAYRNMLLERGVPAEDISPYFEPFNKGLSGESIYKIFARELGGDKEASQFLNRQGFVGISYPANATTGGRADGARNYVIFNEDDAQIEEHVMFRMSKTPQEFDATQKEAVEKHGVVSPGLNNTAVNVVDVPRHDFTGNLKEARLKAKEWAIDNYTDRDFDLPGNAGKYVISKNAIGKYLDKSAFDKSENATVHLSVLKELPNVISNSIEVEIHADYSKGENGERNAENGVNRNDLLVHRIYGAVNIDGNTYRVKTTIHEFRDANTANTPHSYEVTKIELIEDSTVTPNDGIDNPLNRSVNSISATKLLEGVEKSYDKGKKVLDESENLTREGGDSITDREVVMDSDPYSKALGRPRYTGRKMGEYVARQRMEMAKRVKALAQKLNLNIDVLESTEGLSGKRAKAKGWYEPKGKRIVVVIPNHSSVNDAVATVLHEAVAHHGLRELFGENFDTFLQNVYNNADADMREAIETLAAQRYNGNLLTATEEYLASLAENTDFEYATKSGWWERIKDYFFKMLRGLGIEGFGGITLTDNELRYILWRSYQNLANPGMYNNVFGRVKDTAKQYELKVGDYAPAVQNGSMVAGEDIADSYTELSYEEAVQIADEFNAKNKGAAPVKFIENLDEFKDLGFTDEEIKEIITRAEKGGAAFYNSDRNTIYLLRRDFGKDVLKALLWHENAHKAVADLGITQELLDDYYASVDEKQREAFEKQIAEEFYEREEYAEEYLARFVEDLYKGKRLSSDNYNVLSRLKNAPENVRKQIEFIQQILNHIVNGRQGRNELRSGMVEGGFTGETIEGGKREGADVYDNATKKSEEGTATADDTRFRIEENSIDNVPTQPLTFTEKITNSVLETSARNKENLTQRSEALRAYGSNLANVLKLMQAQRVYDKSTVDTLMKMAKMYFKNAQLLGHITPYEAGRIMSVLHGAVGKRDVTNDANKLVGILVDAHSKELQGLLDKAAKTKAKKVNASGVEVMGSLDKMGQIALEAYNEAVDLDEKAIEEKIVDAQNDTAHPEEAGARINGLMMALEYVTDIKQKQQEVKDLQALLKEKARDAREGNMSRRAWMVLFYKEVENSADILDNVEKGLSLEQTNIQKDEKSILPERIVDRILRGYSRRERGELPTGEIADIAR